MKIILVIGGGMAGLCAAIEAVRQNPDVSVSILDAGDRAGRKIYATGNGKCNLTNAVDRAECYRTGDGHSAMRFYQSGWNQEVISFMASLGVLTHARNGYYYPRTDQAATVAEALVKEALRLGIQIRCGVKVSACVRTDEGKHFRISAMDGGNNIELAADRVILATGGMVSPLYNCRGDGYRMAKAFGHTIVHPVPALCGLTSDEPFLKMASGVRTAAGISIFRKEGVDPSDAGDLVAASSGEIQMTDTGVSGIPAFQVSRYVRDDHPDCSYYAVLDFIPELDGEQWEEECNRRIGQARPSDTLGDFCLGLVPDKISAWLLAGIGLVREKKIGNIGGGDPGIIRDTLHSIMNVCRAKRIPITGSAGFEKAQATAGGVALSGVSDTMESVVVPGLYFAGEILDVDGICGGYNLTWALHSGRLAGRNAALK